MNRTWWLVLPLVAVLACGGGRATGGDLDKGSFVQPTLFTDVTNDMRIAREEIFGPVLGVLKYDSVDDAIAIDLDLGEHREFDTELSGCEFVDLGITARFLPAELITGEGKNGETFGTVLLV